MESHFEDLDTRPLDRRALLALVPQVTAQRDDDDSTSAWSATDDDERTSAFTRPVGAPSALEATRACAGLELDPLAALEGHARAEFVAGRTSAARAFCERVMAIRRKRSGEDDPELPASFSTLGALAFHQGRLDESTWLFKQAGAILERRGETTTQAMAEFENNLGVVARRRGDYERAREHYASSLALKVELFGWAHRGVALSLANLGRVTELMGDYEEAARDYARARVLAEQTEGAVGAALAASLLGLGRVHLYRGDTTAARFAFERALRIREAMACAPSKLASARFALATCIATADPIEARRLLLTALRDYRAIDGARDDAIAAMEASLDQLNAGLAA